ncbi:MAG: hypothetical protein F6J87_23510 [Spirulina sp. SIO3F2]|nr:hypothetical protein [Spirulina sp. SIO3F2]
MSQLQRLIIEDNGQQVELYIEAPPEQPLPSKPKSGERPGAKGSSTEDVMLKMAEVQQKITTYAKFAIGAFQNLAGAQVEEMTLTFGMKLGGKTGVIFTEGSAEGSMQVSVKCKFKPPAQPENSATD